MRCCDHVVPSCSVSSGCWQVELLASVSLQWRLHSSAGPDYTGGSVTHLKNWPTSFVFIGDTEIGRAVICWIAAQRPARDCAWLKPERQEAVQRFHKGSCEQHSYIRGYVLVRSQRWGLSRERNTSPWLWVLGRGHLSQCCCRFCHQDNHKIKPTQHHVL